LYLLHSRKEVFIDIILINYIVTFKFGALNNLLGDSKGSAKSRTVPNIKEEINYA
jgi:hypothetical protein